MPTGLIHVHSRAIDYEGDRPIVRVNNHNRIPRNQELIITKRRHAIQNDYRPIVQLRVGGNRARLRDETIPLAHGCIGQETTGPGGFAKALRTVPVVLELAELTQRIGAPGAWFVDFTNPTGLVVQALLDRGHRACGLCNVAIGIQRQMADLFAVAPERVQLDHVGLHVESMDEFDGILARAKIRAQADPRVRIIDKHSRVTHGSTADYTLTSCYIAFALPLMFELQHLERHERKPST